MGSLVLAAPSVEQMNARRAREIDVRARIAKVPRVSLACVPTPLHELPQLAQKLGGPRLFIKRDDLTGVALGGNKTRNLEFRLAHTMADNPDVVIAGLDWQSNSARQTVGCCNKLGLRTILVLVGEQPTQIQGNLLVNYLLGAEVHFVRDSAEQRTRMDEIASDLRRQSHRPHILNDNPMFDVASAIAYIESTMEVTAKLADDSLEPTHIYMSSSGKGQAGLELARRAFDDRYQVCGVTATDEFDVPARTAAIANETAQLLGLDIRLDAEEITNYGEYVGPGYGIPSDAGNAAVRLFAEAEGIVLDPIYTGKCAAALVAHCRAGHFAPNDIVVFVHTGGIPAIFTHAALWT